MKSVSNQTMALSDLPIGMSAVVVGMNNFLRGRKKFTDVGMVNGAEVIMEGHAPLGGLLKIKLQESCLALHKNDVRSIKVRVK